MAKPLYTNNSIAAQIRNRNANPQMTAQQMKQWTPIIAWTYIGGARPAGYVLWSDNTSQWYNPNAVLDVNGKPKDYGNNQTQLAPQTLTPPATTVATTQAGSPGVGQNNATNTSQNGGAVWDYSYLNKVTPPPTVATKDNPIVSKTIAGTETGYKPTDYSSIDGLDKNGLQDYLDQLQYKVQYQNKQLTQDEYLQLQRANRRMQELNKADTAKNPYADIISKAQADYEAKQKALSADDQSKLAPQYAQIDDQYGRSQADAERIGKESEQALQGGLSFSGFGRSTYAQQGIQKIKTATADNVRTINLAKDAAKQAALLQEQGADAKVLEGMQSYIDGLMQDSAKYQSAAIQETNKLNQEAGVKYSDRIQNIIELASKNNSGKTYENATPEEKATIDAFAQLAIDKDGKINETLLKSVPPSLAMAVIQRGALVKSQIPTGDYQYVGADKYNGAVVFDKKTGKLISAPWYSRGYGGWSGGWAGGTTPSSLDQINYDNLNFKNQEQANAFGYAARMIDAEKIFNANAASIAWTSTLKWTIQRNSPSFIQSDLFRSQEQAERNFINAVLRRESGASISPTEFESAKKQYFPQPWDDAATLAQKEQNRITTMKATAAQTGKNNASQILPIVQWVVNSKPQNYKEWTKYKDWDSVIRNGKTYKLQWGKFIEI